MEPVNQELIFHLTLDLDGTSQTQGVGKYPHFYIVEVH